MSRIIFGIVFGGWAFLLSIVVLSYFLSLLNERKVRIISNHYKVLFWLTFIATMWLFIAILRSGGNAVYLTERVKGLEESIAQGVFSVKQTQKEWQELNSRNKELEAQIQSTNPYLEENIVRGNLNLKEIYGKLKQNQDGIRGCQEKIKELKFGLDTHIEASLDEVKRNKQGV